MIHTGSDSEKQMIVNAPLLKDMNTGELITVTCPSYFELETVLITSAYYRFHSQEHRFKLFEAREAGLKIEKR